MYGLNFVADGFQVPSSGTGYQAWFDEGKGSSSSPGKTFKVRSGVIRKVILSLALERCDDDEHDRGRAISQIGGLLNVGFHNLTNDLKHLSPSNWAI